MVIPRLRPLLLLLLLIPSLLFSQPLPTVSWDELMQQFAEDAAAAATDDEGTAADLESQIEFLTDLHDHPLDLNHCTLTQLLTLPFLSEASANAIVNFRELNGAFRSLGELLLIGPLTYRERQWMNHCTTVPASSVLTDTVVRPRRPTRMDLLLRADIPFYRREGWTQRQGLAERLRYTLRHGHWETGLRAENDAGETFLQRHRSPFDSYGAFIALHDQGPLQTAILGDFKASFGQGLVLNNNLQLGKVASSHWRTTTALRPHRSTDESNFLRGAAATFALGRSATLTVLYSRRALDATVSDSGTVASINTTGLHRTASELARRGTLLSQTAAIHFALPAISLAPSSVTASRGVPSTFSLGATALLQHYDLPFRQPVASLYRRILPEGHRFGGLSVDYSFRSSRLLLRGETAHSLDHRGGGWATQNRAAWRFSPSTQLTAIHRFYSYHYCAPLASSFGENSQVQNESGLALLLDAGRMGPFALRAFLDYFYSPWPRYTMTRTSDGCEALLQATTRPASTHTFLLRYRFKTKEQSDQRRFTHQFRATYSLPLTPHLSASALLSATAITTPSGSSSAITPEASSGGSTSLGFTLAPRLDYTSPDSRLRASLLAALFRTDDFQSRLYLYEPSLFQSLSMQQLYGRGQRLAATLRYAPSSRWTLQTKFGLTHYTDRDTISTGVLRINSPWKADLSLLLRYHL